MKHKPKPQKQISVINDPMEFQNNLKELFDVPQFKTFYQEYILNNNDYDLSIMYFMTFFTIFIQNGDSDDSFKKLKIIMSNEKTRSNIIKMFGSFGKKIYHDMNLLKDKTETK